MSERWKPKHNPWVIAITVTVATFMEVLDTSIANVALPHISGSLGAGQTEASWVISSYLVANAIVLPISGYLATLIGRKRFYMSCVIMFGLSSLLCGLAPNLPLLLFFRVLQGLGGGGLATSEQAILADTFEPEQLGQAFALYGFAVVLAPAIGPLVGGWITDNFSWRWIFFINVPVALFSVFLTNKYVENSPRQEQETRDLRAHIDQIDYVGFALTALCFGTLEIVLDKGQEDDWFGSPFITALVVTCAASLVVLITWEWWQGRIGRKPVTDLTVFRKRSFSVCFGLMFVMGILFYGTTLILPQLLQTLMGFTATTAGMSLSLGGLATLLFMPLVGVLITKVDGRALLSFGFLLSAVALFRMTHMNLEMTTGYVAWLRFAQAASFGFVFIPISTLSFADMPAEKNNDVSGLTNLARNIGGSVGTCVAITMLARQSQKHQGFLAAHLTGGEQVFRTASSMLQGQLSIGGFSRPDSRMAAFGQLYASLVQHSTMLAYIDVIQGFAFASLVVVPLAFLMKKSQPGTGTMH